MAQPKKTDYTPQLIEYLFNQVLGGKDCEFSRYKYCIGFEALQIIIGVLECPLGEIEIKRDYTIVTNILDVSDYVEFEHNEFLLRYIEPYRVDFDFNIIDAKNTNNEMTDEDDTIQCSIVNDDICYEERRRHYEAQKINKLHGNEKGIFKCKEDEDGYILSAIELKEYYDLLDELEDKGNKVYLEEKFNEFGERKYAASWEWRYFLKEFLPSNNISLSGLSEWEETMLLNGAYKRGADSINFYKIKMRGPNLILTDKPAMFIELWDIIYNEMLYNDEVLKRTYLAVDYPKYLCYDGIIGRYFDCLFKGLDTYKVKSRALLSYTLNRLKEVGYIADNWQNVAEKNFIFMNEEGKFLTANDLAQSKFNISYSLKNKPKGAETIDKIIDGWCK